ncbi:unnamed protein product [Cylicocyclus nassatus]|uniref:Uncharacterized protein n=1 Tax=Cylicocyclus nassatus TaxID=53992 RepID=A0AA36DVT6_CYLNA|nr:unnamed protein product [Cylicocyclus nassatus]
MAESFRCPLYAISPSSTIYTTYQDESSDEYGYATVIANESAFHTIRKDSQQMGGLRRVDCCSNLLDKSFMSEEEQSQLIKKLTMLSKNPSKRALTPPPQFIPICTSTPIVRSCIDIPTTTDSEEKLHFFRMQDRQLSVPTFKPPPPPKESVCKDDLVVLNDRERFWEVELPRDYSKYIEDTATLIARDETTLLLENKPNVLNETYIEEVTIYADPGTESPITRNNTFVKKAKEAVKILWKLRQELLMSQSVTV